MAMCIISVLIRRKKIPGILTVAVLRLSASCSTFLKYAARYLTFYILSMSIQKLKLMMDV